MKKHAFTLIELLVVIAIIAILAAILFPVFAQAKVAAKKTQSLSNVKQVSVGILMYATDYDDSNVLGEYGSGDNHVTWTSAVYPYIKNGRVYNNPNSGVTQVFGVDGIWRSPAYPVAAIQNPTNATQAQTGGFSYGLHHSIFADNFESDQPWFPADQVKPSMSQTQIDNISDKVMMMEKGANVTWNFPWFHPWQAMWVGSIATTAGDESTINRDGVDVYSPSSPMYDPRFDTDCNSTTEGNWECAAHARYRFNEVAPMVFMDGHAKAVKKGGIKWYKNLFIRRGDAAGSWKYWYLDGAVPY